MNQQLTTTLDEVGKPSQVYRTPDGTAILILPYGGRILGLFAPGSSENFYWTHPALATAASARAFYAGDQWHNSGGDRTWLAPEVDFFFPNFPQTDVYWQPRQLDPGDWHLVSRSDGLQLVNRLTCRLSRSKQEVQLEMVKSVVPCANPLCGEASLPSLDAVEFAGYTLRTTLELLGEQAEPGGPVGLWNLIQMPHGGDLLVPTYARTEPRVLFGTVAPRDLEIADHLICYRMRAAGEHKLAVRALAVAGRIGYRYAAQDGRWALVVRNVFVDPSGLYVDVPWTDLQDTGYAIQACNIDSGLGSFSELEYHVPAIGSGTGRRRCEDVTQTWAFRGSRAEINQITARLLAPVASRDL